MFLGGLHGGQEVLPQCQIGLAGAKVADDRANASLAQ
jgi:hypothetical protein